MNNLNLMQQHIDVILSARTTTLCKPKSLGAHSVCQRPPPMISCAKAGNSTIKANIVEPLQSHLTLLILKLQLSKKQKVVVKLVGQKVFLRFSIFNTLTESGCSTDFKIQLGELPKM